MGNIEAKATESRAEDKAKVFAHEQCTVEQILGISELDLVEIPRGQARAERFLLNEKLVNCRTGRATPYGQLQVLRVAELRRRVEAMERPCTSETEKQRIVPLETESKVDIASRQASLTNSDEAMIQVASNFNILENGSISRGPDSGFLVDIASQDTTQGPAAVFGTLSAYLYRVHFAEPVNLLQHVSEYFGVPRNGKLLLTGNEQALTKDTFEHVADNICVGLHTKCPVLFGRDGNQTVFATADMVNDTGLGDHSDDVSVARHSIVDHVLAASVNYNRVGDMSQESLDSVNGNHKAYCDVMARVLLRAAYEATYLAAILQGRKTLLLTLIGGGCFSNPVSIIVEELKAAHERWANHPLSQLQVCRICLYSPRDESEVKRYL